MKMKKMLVIKKMIMNHDNGNDDEDDDLSPMPVESEEAYYTS